jgi:hypothetical protein
MLRTSIDVDYLYVVAIFRVTMYWLISAHITVSEVTTQRILVSSQSVHSDSEDGNCNACQTLDNWH